MCIHNYMSFYTARRQDGFSYYGAGTGAIVLDNVGCISTETNLFDCPHNGLNIHNCAHWGDAGAWCYGKVLIKVEGQYTE